MIQYNPKTLPDAELSWGDGLYKAAKDLFERGVIREVLHFCHSDPSGTPGLAINWGPAACIISPFSACPGGGSGRETSTGSGGTGSPFPLLLSVSPWCPLPGSPQEGGTICLTHPDTPLRLDLAAGVPIPSLRQLHHLPRTRIGRLIHRPLLFSFSGRCLPGAEVCLSLGRLPSGPNSVVLINQPMDQLPDWTEVQLLHSSKFCLLPADEECPLCRLGAVLTAGCLPVFIGGWEMIPFQGCLSWGKVGVLVGPSSAPSLARLLEDISMSASDQVQGVTVTLGGMIEGAPLLSSIQCLILNARPLPEPELVDSVGLSGWLTLNRTLQAMPELVP